MELLTAIIIGIAVASILFFIWVIVWGIRGLSRKEDVHPVHFRPSDLYSSNLAYGSGYRAYDYLGNPVPGPYDPNLSSPYSMGNYLGVGQYVGLSHPSIYTESEYSPYLAGNYPITGKFPTDEYAQAYTGYGDQVFWEPGDSVSEEPGPSLPRIVPKMPVRDDEAQELKEYAGKELKDPERRELKNDYGKENTEYPQELGSPVSALVLTDRGDPPATDGHDGTGTVGDYHDASMFGYPAPALASSEPKALAPVDAASRDFNDVMDYSYTARDMMPSPFSDREDYRGVSSDDYSQDIPTLVPVEPRQPKVERRSRPYKHTLDESTKCNICLGFIKTGLPLLTCVCSKSFHVSCACRMGQCPICTRDLLDYDDLTIRPESKESFDGEMVMLQEVDETGEYPEEKPLSDILAPGNGAMASLTDMQREKLKKLLEKYEFSQRYEKNKTTNFLQ